MPVSLKMDDSTEEKKSNKHDRRPSVLGIGDSEKDPAPMDSNIQEDLGEAKPKIQFNLNFDKSLREEDSEDNDQRETNMFDSKQVFEAAASGNVSQLQGLHHYLQMTEKHLTDSEYQERNGKNALMKALLNLKNGRNDAIEYFLDIAEKMGDLNTFVNAAYTDSFYKGQSALHIAIERRSFYFVELLVQKGADVHAKACGKFFQENEGAYFYFGELPLSLAACTNQLNIVEYLIDNPYQSVRITETDSKGNMVLHALVMIADNTPENTDFVTMMYDQILTRAAKIHPEIKLEDIENPKGLTPIKLAAKTGKIGLFKHMMQREFHDAETKHLSRKFTEWVYGPVRSSLYDLSSIDSYENNSVLAIIVYGSEIPNRHEMLDVGPLARLLDEKWNRFAKWIFNFNFFVYLVYLIIFSLVAYTFFKPIYDDTLLSIILPGYVITALGAVFFFIKALLDLRHRPRTLKALLGDGYYDLLFFLQAIIFFISMALLFNMDEKFLDYTVMYLALSWVNILYFFRGYRSLGIYSVIIQKMILNQISRFLLVYMVFLFGFSTALVILTDDRCTYEPPPENSTEWGHWSCKNNLPVVILQLFKFTIGIGDLNATESLLAKKNTVVFYGLLISYILLTYTLLLNMLIALMSKKAEKLSKESTNIWKLQRAMTTLDVERTLPGCLKTRLRSGVQRQLSGPAGEEKRWYLRVEEVNWNKWNTDIVDEDPGKQDSRKVSVSETGTSWRRALRHLSWRHPHHREMSVQSTRSTRDGKTVYRMPP